MHRGHWDTTTMTIYSMERLRKIQDDDTVCNTSKHIRRRKYKNKLDSTFGEQSRNMGLMGSWDLNSTTIASKDRLCKILDQGVFRSKEAPSTAHVCRSKNTFSKIHAKNT